MNIFSIKIKSFLLLCTFVSSFVTAQLPSQFFDAVKSENFDLMSSYMAPNVNLSIFDNDQLNNKSVAIDRIKTLLSSNEVSSISSVHTGSDKSNGSVYRVGKLKTSKGNLRLFVYAEKIGSDWKVKEVRFEK